LIDCYTNNTLDNLEDNICYEMSPFIKDIVWDRTYTDLEYDLELLIHLNIDSNISNTIISISYKDYDKKYYNLNRWNKNK